MQRRHAGWRGSYIRWLKGEYLARRCPWNLDSVKHKGEVCLAQVGDDGHAHAGAVDNRDIVGEPVA